jgi:pyruvate/2-oxoglutarate dehydrogenase complex dihydrolipoamide acyltransferase (E2) component
MNVKALKPFYDVDTRKHYRPGDVLEWDDARANHYIGTGLVAAVDDAPPAPADLPLLITPKALELANQSGVRWMAITGTGANGTITIADVRSFVNANS